MTIAIIIDDDILLCNELSNSNNQKEDSTMSFSGI